MYHDGMQASVRRDGESLTWFHNWTRLRIAPPDVTGGQRSPLRLYTSLETLGAEGGGGTSSVVWVCHMNVVF